MNQLTQKRLWLHGLRVSSYYINNQIIIKCKSVHFITHMGAHMQWSLLTEENCNKQVEHWNVMRTEYHTCSGSVPLPCSGRANQLVIASHKVLHIVFEDNTVR